METRSVGVWLPGPVGDIVMATPALDAIQAAYPLARRVGYVPASAEQLLDGGPWFQEVKVRSREVGAMGRTLRQERHDLMVLFTNSMRSALIAWRGRARRRIGYRAAGRGALLSQAVRRSRGRHAQDPAPMVETYLELLRKAGIPAPETGPVSLFTTEEERRMAGPLLDELGDGHSPIVAVSPGASYGPAKCWPSHRYADVVERLTSDREIPARAVLLFAPGEEDLARDIHERMTHRDRVLHVPTDLGTAKAILERASLHLTNDTGARHMGHALGVTTIAILGPTHPEWSDYPEQRGQVLRVDVKCGPCMKRTCSIEDHTCMEDIHAHRVVELAGAYLRGAQ